MLLLFLLISSSSASLLRKQHLGPKFLPEDVPVKHLMFKGVCGDFLEGACDLSENNIVGHNRFTDTPGECQDLCQADPTCHWFTHFDTQCYLLTDCGNSAHCSGCVSGPENPDFGTCPWPPHPTVEPTTPRTTTTTKSTTTTTKSTTTTTKSTTTTTKSTTTTTKSTTTTTKSTTTTTKKTTTTTKRTTTTTTPDPTEGCDDIHINSECDWNYGLITWYEQVMTGSECQYICKNVNGAKFFSHYNEGHQGEHGFCGCFSSCAWPTTEGCDASCSTHETFEESDEERFTVKRKVVEEQLDSGELDGGEVDVELEIHGQPRPGPKYCHCMRGPLSPDADTCDLWG